MPRAQIDLSVDRDSDVPLATQLAWKLRTLVALGDLSPEARLPGVREVAEEAGINVNTVRSVYARLEEEGLVSAQHGRGTFVAADAQPRDALARIAGNAAAAARREGVDPRDVAAAVFASAGPQASSMSATRGPSPRAAEERRRRRALREEIARLEGQLAFAQGLSADGPPQRRPAGRILDTAELEAVRDELRAHLSAVERERADARNEALAHRAPGRRSEPVSEPATRTWRHGGVWTGSLPPRGIVYES